MYKVASIKPAGQGWWEVVIAGPEGQSIPMRENKPGATEEDLFRAAWNRCQRLNVSQGFAKPSEKQELYRRAYRNWATVRIENSKKAEVK